MAKEKLSYRDKGSILEEEFECTGVGGLIEELEHWIEENPIIAVAKIRQAMQNYSEVRAQACLREGKLI